MFCSRCGKKVLEDMLFCPYCGVKLVIPEEEADLPQNGEASFGAKAASEPDRLERFTFDIPDDTAEVGAEKSSEPLPRFTFERFDSEEDAFPDDVEEASDTDAEAERAPSEAAAFSTC